MFLSKRTKFFLGHLGCSLLIALAIISVVFFVWFPTPLANAEGVTRIFWMLLIIDVILGPLLTLLVYKEGKKTLKMDLCIIILLQIIALGYGLYNIAQSRPVWIVQNGSIFQLVRANSIDPLDQKDADSKYNHNGWLKPQWVTLDIDHPKFDNFLEPTTIPYFYTNLNNATKRIQRNSESLDTLNTFNDPKKVKTILKQYPAATAWMPLRTTGLGCVVLINANNGEIVKVVDLRPRKE